MASFQNQQLLIGQVKNSVFHLDDISVFYHFSFSLFPKFSNFLIRQSFVSAFIKLSKTLQNIDWLICQTLRTNQLMITFACHATKSHHSNIVLHSLLKYYRIFSYRNTRTNKPHHLVFCQPLFQKQGERHFLLTLTFSWVQDATLLLCCFHSLEPFWPNFAIPYGNVFATRRMR